MNLSTLFRSVSWFVLLFCLALTGFGQDEKKEEPESGDGKAAVDRPVDASEEAIQAIGGFKKPEGWGISLFAAEPEFANPVCMYVDNLGRVFVCESFRQDRGVTDNRGHDQEWLMADLAANSVQDRVAYHKRLLGDSISEYTAHDDRIRMLVDTDGDGMADKATVFAEQFNNIEDGSAAGILVRGNTAYFTCIPKLWKLTDSDGDGQAESRTALHDGFGVRVAFRGHDMHGLIIGHDGRLYFSIGDRGYNVSLPDGKLFDPESGAVFRCELDGSNLEVFATGLRNPQELAFDDHGFLFTGDNNSDSGDKARWVNVMEGGDSGWRMMYQYFPDRGPFNRERLWEPYQDKTPAYIVPPIANLSDGPSGLACYPGTGLKGDYANCFFLVDFRGGAANSGIRLIRAQADGAFWKVERSEQPIWNILATDAQFGPDGALWVCDWVNGWVGEGKGRVYRFFDEQESQSPAVREVKEILTSGVGNFPTNRLTGLLGHPDRRVRLEAQWELAARKEVTALKLATGQSEGPMKRLHATWGLAQIARQHEEERDSAARHLIQSLTDSDPHIRRSAATGLAEARITSATGAIVKLILDSHPQVRYAATLAAGRLKSDAALDSILEMIVTNADKDPGLRHAGIMGLAGIPDASKVVGLASHPSRHVRLAAVVALRKKLHSGVADFLKDSDADIQTEAARAIHDVVAMHNQLPKLATMLNTPLANDALAHRVLNAAFRLGEPASAEGLAAFAANARNTETMRMEAISMLGQWASPGKLDRVMNRYLPLEDRDSGPARIALAKHFVEILKGPSVIQAKALEVATELKVDGLATVLRKYAGDTSADSDLRMQAIKSLANLEMDKAAPDVRQMLADSNATIRATALGILSRIDPAGALESLEKATHSQDMVERQAAWDALANNRTDGAKAVVTRGLQAYIAGQLPKDVWMNVIEAAEGKADKSVMDQLTAFEQKLASSDPLEAYRDCVEGGNVAAGRRLFFTKSELSCVRCHKVADRGGEVGPDLSRIAATKDNRYLLEAIVAPDAKIAENFQTIIVLQDDGTVVSGILRKESEENIDLMDAEGKLITIDKDSIESRKVGKSSMPPDLIKHMSRRELRDLVAYLASLKDKTQ